MRIVLISDTHIPDRCPRLPDGFLDSMKSHRPDLLVHCGDLVTSDLLAELEYVAPVRAVAGNMDPPDVFWRIRQRHVIEDCNRRIGVVHGHGSSYAQANAAAAFESEPVDCILYGHSHKPSVERIDGVLYVNPGSPTDFRRPYVKVKKPSYALVQVEERGVEARLLYF